MCQRSLLFVGRFDFVESTIAEWRRFLDDWLVHSDICIQ